MKRFLPALSLISIFLFCGLAKAQSAQGSSANTLTAKPIPDEVRVLPFSQTAGSAHPVEFLSADQMAPQDRALAAKAQFAIAKDAGVGGMEFNQGKWSYKQLVCTALPNHLFLRYTRNGGRGDVSMFSVSIPRNGDGPVRMIPIRRRGYSLFTPAPINASTISIFNHIRAEDDSNKLPGWLGTGLCYAALAGANPQVALPTAPSGGGAKVAAVAPPILQIGGDSGVTVRFTDATARPQPMEWILVFDDKGKLLKTSRLRASMAIGRTIPSTGATEKSRPVPPTIQNVSGKPVQ